VWVKAIASVETRSGARDRPVWKKSLNCSGAGREWKTFRMVFPVGTKLPPAVSRARIELYPFWPPATYWFDDVRLFEISEEEARAFEAQRLGEGKDEKEAAPAAPDPAAREGKAPPPPGTSGSQQGAQAHSGSRR
jgi:hypothetical protein